MSALLLLSPINIKYYFDIEHLVFSISFKYSVHTLTASSNVL